MNHLRSFVPRRVISLPVFSQHEWRLKQYAIVSSEKALNDAVTLAAAKEAVKRLPKAGQISDETANHGIGFQIVHFAEIAVVAPVFYWQWGSVLAHINQIRAPWTQPTVFGDGVSEFIGCVWEMEIVNFEVQAWKKTVLKNDDKPTEKLAKYIAELATEQHHFSLSKL